MNTHHRIIDAIAAQPWAIMPESLEQIVSIAQGHGDLDALATKVGKPLQGAQKIRMRGDMAIVPVVGPIFRYANLFTDISGGTSTEILARDITAALESPEVRSIALNIDSPGGQANGISELAELIYQGNRTKPITAYVGGIGASGAYWLASAAGSMVIADTAILGSIGAIFSARVRKDDQSIEIVSSNAPGKRPDLSTDEGKASIQALVDKLETVFINAVARYRNVSRETVLNDFGRGGLLVGEEAVAVAMADSLGSLESVIAGFAGDNRGVSIMTTAKSAGEQPAITLDLIKSQYPDIADALRAEGKTEGQKVGVETERARIQAVHEQGRKLPGHSELVTRLMFDGKTTGPEAAVEILAAESQARGKSLEDIRTDAPKPATQAEFRPSINKNAPVEDRCKAEWDQSPELRTEFGTLDAYLAFKRADEGGRVRILGGKH